MKKMLCLAAASLALMAQPVFAVLATYTTQYGSTVELEAGQDNTISGFYTMNSVILNKFCSAALTDPRKPLTGTNVDNTISFTVAYPECNKSLVITGSLVGGNIFKLTSVTSSQTTLAADEMKLAR